jgi:hypothetical protein
MTMNNPPALLLPTWPEPTDATFNAPLKVVNAEIFSILRTWAHQTGLPLAHQETQGAVGYTVRLPSGLVCLVDVLCRDEEQTTVRIQYPWHYDALITEGMGQGLSAEAMAARFDRDLVWCQQVYHRCGRGVVQAMRYRRRAFALDPNVFAPPPPQWDSRDRQLQRAAIVWKDLYHPGMADRDFAALLGIEEGSLRNARSRLKLSVRPTPATEVRRAGKRSDQK